MFYMSNRPTGEEDGILRRLHWFESFGATLSPEMREIKANIRARDLRLEIRAPSDAGGPVLDPLGAVVSPLAEVVGLECGPESSGPPELTIVARLEA